MGLLGCRSHRMASILGRQRHRLLPVAAETRHHWVSTGSRERAAIGGAFVPMERLWPLRPEQSTFRRAWTTDTLYFLMSHLFVQVTTFLILAPARRGVCSVRGTGVAPDSGRTPAGRAVFRRVALRRSGRVFHPPRVSTGFQRCGLPRHSPFQSRHGLAGGLSPAHRRRHRHARALSSFHCSRSGSTSVRRRVPGVVSFHAVFIHANVRFDLRRLEPWIVTPRFHHWHHAKDRAAIDKNFAVHLPWIDRLFGTVYEPAGKWPETLRHRG